MKIAIIGAGSMGSIYAGKLSKANDVSLIGSHQDIVDLINSKGLKIDEDGLTNTYYPKAYVESTLIGKVELIILFVKSTDSKKALEQNKNLIDKNTYILTLQNGGGHQDLIKNYVNEDKIIIGTTEDGGKKVAPAHIARNGIGKTNIGFYNSKDIDKLNDIKEAFDLGGFKTFIYENINQLIWNKIFINTSLSATTALLKCESGYLGESKNALYLVKELLKEAVLVAQNLGLNADYNKEIERVLNVIENSKDGITSICADIRNFRKTEVDTISGYVIKTAKKLNIDTPIHNFVVNQIHALEDYIIN